VKLIATKSHKTMKSTINNPSELGQTRRFNARTTQTAVFACALALTGTSHAATVIDNFNVAHDGSSFTQNPSVVNGKVTWSHSAAATGATYRVLISENLKDWTDVTADATDSDGFLKYTLPNTTPKRFVCLEVSISP
jgi:uncharacterized iron-regulated membrane protein